MQTSALEIEDEHASAGAGSEAASATAARVAEGLRLLRATMALLRATLDAFEATGPEGVGAAGVSDFDGVADACRELHDVAIDAADAINSGGVEDDGLCDALDKDDGETEGEDKEGAGADAGECKEGDGDEGGEAARQPPP